MIAGKQRTNRDERTAVLVLGMHRSGTSALARALNLLGCDLPKTLLGATASNPTGHWESKVICALNDRLLQSAGSAWYDWAAFPQSWYHSPKRREFGEEALAVLSAEFGASPLFVFKDPRICRIAPFWLDSLRAAGISPVAVLPLRNPLEVGASLEKRNGFDPALGHLLWLRHVLDAEAASRGLPRCFLSYDQLLQDRIALLKKVKKSLGVKWPRQSAKAAAAIDAYLSEGQRHHRIDSENLLKDRMISLWIRDSFSILSRWTRHGEDEADWLALNRIRADLDSAVPAFAGLIERARDEAVKLRALGDDLARSQAKLAARESMAAERKRRLNEALKHSKALEAQLTACQARLAEVKGGTDGAGAASQGAASPEPASPAGSSDG